MSFTPDPAEGQRIHALDRAHVFHSWSAQGALNPMDIAAAEGCYVWDYDGNRYLDLSSQLVNVNIGHQHPKVVKAIQDQAAKLSTIALRTASAASTVLQANMVGPAPEIEQPSAPAAIAASRTQAPSSQALTRAPRRSRFIGPSPPTTRQNSDQSIVPWS